MVDKKNLYEVGILFFFILLDVGFTYYGLTKGGGAQDSGIVEKVGIYNIAFTGGLLILLTAKIAKSINPSNKFFASFKIFEVEKSQFKGIKKYIGTPLKMTLASILVFGAIGLFSVQSNTFFTEAGLGEQQVTSTARVIDGAFPSANAETFALLSFFFVGLGYINTKLSKNPRIVGLIILFAILTRGWVVYHSLVYGTDQVSTIFTGLFALLGLGITYLTFSIIPFTIWHILNNIFIKLNEFANDDVVTVTTIIVLGLIAWWWISLVRTPNKVPGAIRG